MIVLDEQIYQSSIVAQIASWYRGGVVSIRSLRPRTVVKDDAIATVLRTTNAPTFVTINLKDFWRVIPVDAHYSIVCIDLPNTQSPEVPFLLRRLLNMSQFKTKMARMGKVICIRPTRVDYYGADGRLEAIQLK